MRITLISDPELVNSNYRAYQPMHVLSARGHEIDRNVSNIPRFEMARLLRSDAVLIHRYCDPEIQRLALELRRRGIGVVWDNDDDVTAVPRSNPLGVYKGVNRHRVASGVVAMVRAVDIVTAPCEELAGGFRAAGAVKVKVLENYVRDDFIRTRGRRRGEEIVIGWLAGLEHRLDLEALELGRTLQRLVDTWPVVRVVSIGVNLGLRSDRYEHIRGVRFLDIPNALERFDIGIAPLADIPFNRARSNVKVKEYAAAGAMWLASPVGPYAGHGEDEGGRLVENGRWLDEIGRLLDRPRERRRLAKRAGKWARTQTIGRHADLWESTLLEAIEHARSTARTGPVAAREIGAMP